MMFPCSDRSCSGSCSVCIYGDIDTCPAIRYDRDEFTLASKETIISRLDNDKHKLSTDTMINILKNEYGYEYKKNQDDGIYIEVFVIKNGVRYNAKIINMKDVSITLTNSLMDGIQKLCE